MANTRVSISTLFGGVSTQPSALRHSNQVETADNVYFSVRDDASKRPGAEHLFTIADLSTAVDYRIHAIDRDETEKYLLIYGDSTLRIFDLEGVEQSVTISADAQTYLDAHDATCDEMRPVTIADYTLLANTTVNVSATTSPYYAITATADDYDILIARLGTPDGYYQAEGDTPAHPKGYWQYTLSSGDNGFATWTGADVSGNWDIATDYWDTEAYNPMGFKIGLQRQAMSLSGVTWQPAAKKLVATTAVNQTDSFNLYTYQSGDELVDLSNNVAYAIAAKDSDTQLSMTDDVPGSPITGRLLFCGKRLSVTNGSYVSATGVLTLPAGTLTGYGWQNGDDIAITINGFNQICAVTSSSGDTVTIATGLGNSSTVVASAIGFFNSSTFYNTHVYYRPAYTLRKAGAFAAYQWASGDQIYVASGTGVSAGWYTVASKVYDDSIALTSSIAVASVADVATTSIGRQYNCIENFWQDPPADMYEIAARYQANLQSQGIPDVIVQWQAPPVTTNGRFVIVSPYRGTGTTIVSLTTPANADPDGDLTASGKPFTGGTIVAGSGSPATATYSILDRWEAVPAPAQRDAVFEATTLPIKIVRTAFGSPSTFDVDVIDWTPRLSGNEDTNPLPSLWDSEDGAPTATIADISFHRNRLVLCGHENIVFSQASDFFNLWIEDADNLGDSDPIDVAMSSDRVTITDFVVPFRKTMVVFTKAGQQFELNAPEVLSPSTASLTPSTRYNSIIGARPATSGTQIYFAAQAESGAQVREYAYDDTYASNIAADITSHVEGYLPADVDTIVSCANANVLMVMDRGDNKMFRYRAYWNGAEKLQSAWSRLVFHSSYALQDITAIGNNVYILAKVG